MLGNCTVLELFADNLTRCLLLDEQVGVHNGWTYVDFPEVAHLRPDRAAGGALDQTSPSKKSSGKGLGASTGSEGDAAGRKQKNKSALMSSKAPVATLLDSTNASDQPPPLPVTFLSSKYRVELSDLIEHRQSQVTERGPVLCTHHSYSCT